MKMYSIDVYDNKIKKKARLTIDGQEITFIYGTFTIKESDLEPFVALKKIRRKLEDYEIFILINGSRINVHPSNLLSQSFSAYVHEIGKISGSENIVSILDPIENEFLIGTVKEQEEYHRKWIESMRNL